ncbi:MAG TPA: SOS response-associated peptidase [Streptosporangiaceae bacterium]|jgi:putative SOS response-associated peptidase YedK|nr:SOS response-associated peptidase [Streptosporangiaceae bacterium]
MCGRYASARRRIELLEEFGVQPDEDGEELRPDYNVAPTKKIYAVMTRRPPGLAGAEGGNGSGGDGAAEAAAKAAEELAPVRQLRTVRWGLVPSWAKDPAIGSRMINARAETVASKPAYRRAFAKRRCLLPADGYYEWYKPGEEKAAKQPYFIHRADGAPLAFAGLYEFWRDQAHPGDHPDAWLVTATIITTSAPDELGVIHERMPMVIGPGQWAEWLDPDLQDPAQLAHLLAPAVSSGLITTRVSTKVNSVRNNGPELIEPASDDAADGSAGEPPARGGGPGEGPATTLF